MLGQGLPLSTYVTLTASQKLTCSVGPTFLLHRDYTNLVYKVQHNNQCSNSGSQSAVLCTLERARIMENARLERDDRQLQRCINLGMY